MMKFLRLRLTRMYCACLLSSLQLRSYHETPYSSRIARSVESTRIDCARMAKKVHNLFKFVNPIATGGSTQPSPSNDATILKFAPLFQTYASISRILNATCMESIAFEEQLAKKGSVVGGPGGPHRRSPPGSSASSARRRNAGGSSSNITPGVYDPMSDETTLDDDSTSSMSESQQSMMSASNETLPLLTVDGMEAYEAEKKQGDFMNLQSMVLDIAQSFHTLQQITMQQQEQLDQAESNVVNAREKTLAAELEIRKASRYKAFGLVLAGGATGAAIGGPLGALVGLKTGLSIGVGIGLMGAGGALIGAAAGKQIQKARFVPLTHGAEEAELVEREKKNEARTEEIKASESTATTAPSSVVPSPAQGRKSCSALRKCL
jgi:proteasome assembly chaperone (PAC2) family protein